MASNGVSINPQVRVLDPTFNLAHQKDLFQTNEPSRVIIHTGNVANWNSLKSRKTQLPINEVYIFEHYVLNIISAKTAKYFCIAFIVLFGTCLVVSYWLPSNSYIWNRSKH